MATTATELAGAWRLVSWSFVHGDGRPDEYPMGRDARGFILYTPSGEVSATIMRADKSECFAYAGRYEVKDGSMFHFIEVSTEPKLVGARSTRRIELCNGQLVLTGPDFQPATGRTQKIVWKR